GGAGAVVERLGPGERMAAADAGRAQAPALRFLGAVLLFEQPRPDAPAGAVLRHLLEEVRVRVEEEAEPRREAVRGQPAGKQVLYIRLAGAKRVRHLLCRVGAGIAVVGGDADRIEARQPLHRVLDQIAGEPHGWLDGEQPGAARAELLEQIVLHGP